MLTRTMIAVKKQVVIPPSRHIELDLPKDTPEGVAEVIVLVPASAPADPLAALEGIFAHIPDDEWEEIQQGMREARKTDKLRDGDEP